MRHPPFREAELSSMAQGDDKGSRFRLWPRLLFLIPLCAVLLVPSYNRLEPTLGGVPFFYWYQLAWILIGAAIVLLVYKLDRKIAHIPKDSRDDTTGIPGDIL
jgi:uncharacterized protein DUF3311